MSTAYSIITFSCTIQGQLRIGYRGCFPTIHEAEDTFLQSPNLLRHDPDTGVQSYALLAIWSIRSAPVADEIVSCWRYDIAAERWVQDHRIPQPVPESYLVAA